LGVANFIGPPCISYCYPWTDKKQWQPTRSVFDALFATAPTPSMGGPSPNTSRNRSFS